MRVVCTTIEELLSDLEKNPEQLFQKCIRVSTSRNPLDGKTKRDAARFRVSMIVSAVVQLPEGEEYIIECGEDCGIDYEDSTNERPGSAYAKAQLTKIEKFAKLHGLSVRPGVISP